LRLELGDDIHAVIQEYCANNHINNASISGLGNVENIRLGHYSVKTKRMAEKSFEGIYDVSSITGNISLVDNQPFSHLHITITDNNMQAFGGHLVSGTCSATLELFLQEFDTKYRKVHDDAIGLNLWDI
jgi:predicted DNA-binding protein with PD1-like motif